MIFIRELIIFLKELLQIAFYTLFSNPAWLQSFNASIGALIVKPLFSFFILALAIIQLIFAIQSTHYYFDLWFNALMSLASASLGAASLLGATITFVLGTGFMVGAWLFLAALAVGFVQLSLNLGLNLIRASESLKNSQQKRDYRDTAIANSVHLLILSFAILSVVFSFIVPGFPLVATVFSALTAVSVAIDLVWHFSPLKVKQVVKETILDTPIMLHQEREKSFDFSYKRLFTSVNYKEQLKGYAPEQQKACLMQIITDKTALLSKKEEKQELLHQLIEALEQNKLLPKKASMQKMYPEAFETILKEKSETEQLFDAVYAYQDRFVKNQELYSLAETDLNSPKNIVVTP